ncbi:MAG: MFS transporter [Pirellulales bacterium]
MSDSPAASTTPPAEQTAPIRLYGPRFWCVYAANTSLMVAVSLLFRYSDFVHLLGGDELNLGLIIGVGMTGSLVVRVFQGVGIDRYGNRLIWLVSLLLFSASCLAHLLVTHVDGPLVFAVRVLLNVSIAGCFGASISYITRTAPLARMAEVVGTLGSSGFVGMITGPALGDLIFGPGPVEPQHIRWMFAVAAGLAGVSFVLAWFATLGQTVPPRRRRPPIAGVLRRYHPGAVLAVGIAMGFGIGLPGVFLRPFSAQLEISGMAWFFTVYALVAFAMRMAVRRLPERIGNRPMVLMGLGFLAAGMLAFLLVHNEWQLVFPAVAIATSHAMLFPSVVAEVNSAFPGRYRGLATTLILGMVDIGTLVGAPTIGAIVRIASLAGAPPYPSAFITAALLLAGIGVFYAVAGRRVTAGSRRNVRVLATVAPGAQAVAPGAQAIVPIRPEAGSDEPEALPVEA